jgi:hypothetical protein
VNFLSCEKHSIDRSRKMKKLILPLLFSTVVVTGCATTGGSSPSRPTTAALECGAGGAGAALLICKLAGGSDAICAAATGGAALVGAGACYGVATHYEQRRKELAGKEQNVDALLAFAKTNNAEAEKANQQLNAKLTEVSRRVDEIDSEIKQGTATSQQLVREKEALQKDLEKEQKAANEQAEVQKVALQDMKNLRSNLPSKKDEDEAQVAELDAEIAKQEALLKEAQRATTAFAAQAGRL